MGFGHRGAAWIEYLTMSGCVATALLVRTAQPGMQAGALAAATLILIAIAAWIDVRWARWSRAQGGSGGAPA